MLGKVNVAIIGTGSIAGKMASTLKHMRSVKCYAIASRTLEKAQKFAEEYGFKKAYGSYEEMVQDKKVDLVYVATPHSEHFDHAMLCIKYGKAVLCEKAFTANAKQAEELLSYAEENSVLITEAIWTRYMPMMQTIKEVLASGVIGEVEMLTANLGYAIEGKERMTNPMLAGGALLDLGIYPIHFASMILGTDVKEIKSACTYTDTGVDSRNSITLIYQDGKMAVLNSTMLAASDRKGMLYGTKGYAVIENINNFESMTVYDSQNNKLGFYKRPKQITGYEYEVEACVRAIKEGWKQCPEIPHEETLRIMKLMDYLRQEWGIRYPFEE